MYYDMYTLYIWLYVYYIHIIICIHYIYNHMYISYIYIKTTAKSTIWLRFCGINLLTRDFTFNWRLFLSEVEKMWLLFWMNLRKIIAWKWSAFKIEKDENQESWAFLIEISSIKLIKNAFLRVPPVVDVFEEYSW